MEFGSKFIKKTVKSLNIWIIKGFQFDLIEVDGSLSFD